MVRIYFNERSLVDTHDVRDSLNTLQRKLEDPSTVFLEATLKGNNATDLKILIRKSLIFKMQELN